LVTRSCGLIFPRHSIRGHEVVSEAGDRTPHQFFAIGDEYVEIKHRTVQ
jgi:hypothetical protein